MEACSQQWPWESGARGCGEVMVQSYLGLSQPTCTFHLGKKKKKVVIMEFVSGDP